MPTYAIGLILLVAGLGLCSLMFWLISKKRAKIATWTKTTGLVKGFNSTTSDGTTMYAPVVEFPDTRGQPQLYESRTYSWPQKLNVGDSVKLAFDPTNPDEASLLSFSELYLPLLGGLIAGGSALVIGTIMYLAN